ncbi:MAG: thiamine pyrophosphate-dependent enzyme, partial [Chloroflexota bacterium]
MQSWEAFYGPNVGYVLEQYERFLQDPKSVEPETRAFFAQMGQLGDLSAAATTLARPATRTSRSSAPNGRTTQSDAGAAPSANGGSAPASESPGGFVAPAHTMDDHQVATIVFAARLARSIREYGHLDAMIDPLGAPRPGDPMLDARTHTITDDELAGLPGSIVFPAGSGMSCLDAIQRLRAIYCGASGYEFDHVQDYEERTWLHSVVESGAFHATLSTDQRRSLLHRLSQVEGFERFLHTVFQGQKRFSIEGNDTLVPILDAVLDEGAETGIREVVIGMAHRGRLNVLAHVLGKSYSDIFGEFHTARKREHAVQSSASVGDGGGDVKYHRGAYHEVRRGSSTLAITLSDNPSHLEVVNPVTEGFTRATQDDRSRPGRPVQDLDRALCITIHGDAAFPGEGVVAETLNLSRLPGYHTGGTIHIIVNNQIGFTTRTEDARSTLYSSDLAKGFEIPIVHVNADDPEACVSVARLASAYRRRFHKDFLIDLVGYRRWGHNEGDEPAFTQPAMYAEVRSHPSVRALYAGRLVGDAVLSDGDAETMVQTIQQELRSARDDSEQTLPAPTPESET